MRVNAYAAPSAGQPLAPTTIERREVGVNDVLIAIEFAGICHSDIHTVNGDWGPQPFPVVPGHEIVGTVTEVGSAVSRHRVYDEGDLDELMWVSCLAATGMSVSDMRLYMANNRRGAEAAADQRRLLEEQQQRLATEARALVLRQRYVAVKVAYWQAVQAGDTTRAGQVAAQARELADELRAVTHD